jgi:hypothetical protein
MMENGRGGEFMCDTFDKVEDLCKCHNVCITTIKEKRIHSQ